jgi:lysophospholipase L1-like esterase
MLLRFRLGRVRFEYYIFTIIFLCLTTFLSSCNSGNTGKDSSTHLKVQPTPSTHLNYVALGASDGWGTGADDPEDENWPVDLADKLGNQTHLVNLGVPGITLHDALDVELPVALDAHPQLVTIWLAVDDLLANIPIESYNHDLDFLLTRLQATNPHVHIALANIPDLTLLPRFRTADQNTIQSLRSQITAYNATIENAAQQHQVVLVDLYKQWNLITDHPEYISADGFHPSTQGYAQLAEVFYQTLKTAKYL